ncbi:MAG: aminotransferase class I/II-fold pyridoxal phosphate-dependent enzyme [Gammaproteobacteria bacterium]|uniref:Aminotransferase n=1 Tax=Candidatus Thiopontia autotrophica TaxID=2841688 RepID=A0A8J6TXR9_9GAMM|nr:aminotransferase class I/II-fold pyridoxal phosphate-dependent enzyme [Candidatus Thiopontia autotrophica]MBL6968895.1 aminotransferase class I/II-fold pyridoxal phosphate-dependent enzyme [Gammaproteobacteria bacterium]
MSFRPSDRVEEIEPFYVMELLARARELEREGRTIVHMEVGEPDFDTPESIVRAGVEALNKGHHHYTPALGLTELREKIADHYNSTYGKKVLAEQIVVTPGSSGALQLLIALLVNPGDEVLMADPGYPCNRHFVRIFEGVTVSVPVDATTRFQLTAELVGKYWSEKSRVVMISSPSNPTGSVIAANELKKIALLVEERGGVLIVDEIYQGLIYDGSRDTAIDLPGTVFVVNSFSKYYGMTGWRLGWLVSLNMEAVSGLDRLSQNLFLAPPTPSQYAALVAFEPETERVLQERCDRFRRRRDFLYAALLELGLKIDRVPDGAFYLYADCSDLSSDSSQFAADLLEQAGVAVTPGKDFTVRDPRRWIRFAYTTSLDQLQLGVERIRSFLSTQGGMGR